MCCVGFFGRTGQLHYTAPKDRRESRPDRLHVSAHRVLARTQHDTQETRAGTAGHVQARAQARGLEGARGRPQPQHEAAANHPASPATRAAEHLPRLPSSASTQPLSYQPTHGQPSRARSGSRGAARSGIGATARKSESRKAVQLQNNAGYGNEQHGTAASACSDGIPSRASPATRPAPATDRTS